MYRSRIPMRFRRCGGRKRIVAPDGSELAPVRSPQPDGALVKALARAHRWHGMLEEGGVLFRARAGGSGARQHLLCQPVLRLTLLAPDVVERILDGQPTAGLGAFLKPFTVE